MTPRPAPAPTAPASRSRGLLLDLGAALLLLALSLTFDGYEFATGDQLLEIPILKKLIDPTLYPNDPHVAAAASGFATYFYPLLAAITPLDRVPQVFFLLYFPITLARTFAVFKLLSWLAGGRGAGLAASAMFLVGQEEGAGSFITPLFENQTTHSALVLPFTLGSLLALFRGRFVLSAALLGAGVNFHALSCFFPWLVLAIELARDAWKTRTPKRILLSAGAFLLGACLWIPWLLKGTSIVIPHDAGDLHPMAWLKYYRIFDLSLFPFTGVTRDNFFSESWRWAGYSFGYPALLLMFALNFRWNEAFRKRPEALHFCLAAAALMAVSFVFTTLHPVRWVWNLSLPRSMNWSYFLLTGFTGILLVRLYARGDDFLRLLVFPAFFLTPLTKYLFVYLSCVGAYLALRESPLWSRAALRPAFRAAVLAVPLAVFALSPMGLGLVGGMRHDSIGRAHWYPLLCLAAGGLFLLLGRKGEPRPWERRLGLPAGGLARGAVVAALVAAAHAFLPARGSLLRYDPRTGLPPGGDPVEADWLDLQFEARRSTGKDALFLTPPELGGFRAYSERPIVASLKDMAFGGYNIGAMRDTWARLVELGVPDVDVPPERYASVEVPWSRVRIGYRDLGAAKLGALARKYGASRVVQWLESPVCARPEVLYRNGSFCLLPAPPPAS